MLVYPVSFYIYSDWLAYFKKTSRTKVHINKEMLMKAKRKWGWLQCQGLNEALELFNKVYGTCLRIYKRKWLHYTVEAL